MVGCIFEVLSFPLTGTPLDAVPVPGAILTRSPRATHSSSHSSSPIRRPFPHPIKYSINFINYMSKYKNRYLGSICKKI